jgi:serine protease Do
MGLPLIGRARGAAAIFAGLSLVAGLGGHGWNCASGANLAPVAQGSSAAAGGAAVNDVPPNAPPRADRIAGNPADMPVVTDDVDDLDIAALQGQFEAVARRVAPAVVSISAAEVASPADDTVRSEAMNPQLLQTVLDKTTRTIGTGFIVDADGFIVTNEHVIEGSEQFWVTTDDHRVFPAIIVGADPRADLAVLKIPATNLPTVTFAADPCQRGQWAITIGNPYGLATEGQMAMSVGVVSATDRSLPRLAIKEDRLYFNLIQTTAQINPGNSGGPLLDLDGRVIGIDTAVILPQKQTNGIGFALPVTRTLLDEINQLEQGREVIYGYVGVTVATPTMKQREDAGLREEIGVCVETVEDASPAAADGLKTGDLIIGIDGQAVPDTDHFVRMVGATPVGHAVAIGIARGGKKLSINVTPVKRPVQFVVSNENQRLYWRGMVLGPVPANWTPVAGDDKHRNGILVVGIQDDSPLKKQGVRAGMVITSIAGKPVASMIEVQRILNDIPPEQCTVETAADTTEVATAKK